MTLERILRKFLPMGSLEEFTVTGFEEEPGKEEFDETYYLELTEKLYKPSGFGEVRLTQKGYSIRKVIDFPIRGRKTVIVYKRRKWSIEGQPGIYMRPLEINADGVKLSSEFAFFFTEED